MADPERTRPFNTYHIYYFSKDPKLQASIELFNTGALTGFIGFYADGGIVPPNGEVPMGGMLVPAIYYPLSRFESVIGIIRYTKPLYLFLDVSNGNGYLAMSARNPVGEQEGH